MKVIDVYIDKKTGAARVETKGFVGKECFDVAGPLEKALGVVAETKKTPEFEVKHVQTQGN